MKTDPLIVRSETGFYNYFVNQNGLQHFDEKEVDVRIAIRAMEQCVRKTADHVCIVSSDQDFLPLHERLNKGGLVTYHADAAKFATPDKVGRKIKSLGRKHISVQVDKAWPLRMIIEASKPALYDLSGDELSALCRIFNSLGNEFEISFVENGDGTAGLRMYKPLRN